MLQSSKNYNTNDTDNFTELLYYYKGNLQKVHENSGNNIYKIKIIQGDPKTNAKENKKITCVFYFFKK